MGLLNTDCLLDILVHAKDDPSCANSPELASNLIWELIYDSKKKKHYGKLSYNGIALDLCKLGNKSDDYICEYNTFKKVQLDLFYLENY